MSGTPEEEERSRKAAAARIKHQATWVDLQIQQAMARGDFDDLPGYGKPLAGLDAEHDPDWWVKRLLEREQVTGILPPSLQLRKEDAALDGELDRLSSDSEVRTAVEEFNARVRWALYRPPEGPPMTTPQRDPEVEVDRWRARREERRAARRERGQPAPSDQPGRRSWLSRWRPKRTQR